MAKRRNKKQQTTRELSPEKYIRTRGRNLPIDKCWVSNDWEEAHFATVVVSRRHSNNNYTSALYMVDLDCLGVKDTFYLFNVPITEIEKLIDKLNSDIGLTEVDYTLAHNIIYAGLEFADDIGFQPHKDFSQVTKFLLEEDTDDIELIEIECGEDGKPHYIKGSLDSAVKEKQVVAHLERTLGEGNYYYTTELELDGDDDNDVDPENKDNDEISKLLEIPFMQRLRDFASKLLDNDKESKPEDLDAIKYSLQNGLSIALDCAEDDIIEELTAEYIDIFDTFDIEYDITDQILRCEECSEEAKELLKQTFIDFHHELEEIVEPQKLIKQLHKKIPKNPAVHYLEVVLLEFEISKKFGKRVAKYAKLFPDYSLLLIKNDTYNLEKGTDLVDDELDIESLLQKYFVDRKQISVYELIALILLLAEHTQNNMDINRLFALAKFTEYIKLRAPFSELIKEHFAVLQFSFAVKLAIINFTNENVHDKSEMESFQFKIQISGVTNPEVWRRITVPSTASFEVFHLAIQNAFGWQNTHIYQFSEDGQNSKFQIIPMFQEDIYDDMEGLELSFTENVELRDIFLQVGQEYRYIYDLGDNWEHKIVLEKIRTTHGIVSMVIEGQGQCPPENCGGFPGYEELKTQLSNTKMPRYNELAQWLGLKNGETWNPHKFDLDKTQKQFSLASLRI